MAATEESRQVPPAEAARLLVRQARKAALATFERRSGYPYVSLVTIATDPDGAPLLLISRLAVHTQNLLSDHRASLMFDGSGPDGDPLAGGRVTLVGTIAPTTSPTAKRRFLARHPHAEGYAGFADFGFYAMTVERAHYIGGFGRIVDLPGSDLMTDLAGAEPLVAAEPGIVAHMNDDHAEAVALYAQKLLGAPAGQWRMIGLDPLGCDLVTDVASLRLPFASRVTNPDAARAEFVRLARHARGQV